MRGTFAVLGTVLVAAMLVAAGCGGNDDEDGGATTGAAGGEPLTKQEFISQADAICRQGDREIERAARDVFDQGQPSREDQEAFITDTVLPEVQGQVDAIRALPAPEGDEEEVTAILDAAQDAIDRGEEDPGVLVDEGGEDPFAEANRLAEQYGLTECG